MKEKVFTLINKGMNRDLSVSKVGDSCVYENHNIRITATDRDTLLSVTNERGTKEISLGASIAGTVIGYNVLNNHIILFTHATGRDRIYRIDYIDEEFTMVRGTFPGSEVDYELNKPLFDGNLGFDEANPIDSVVYAESESIQKIYWVDGKNVLRFLNITAKLSEVNKWTKESFDSNKSIDFSLKASITKEDGGISRPNGVTQYFITYYNKYGQESGFAWISDLVYLSPIGYGGSADGNNNNKVVINLSNFDTSFTSIKVYSIFRSSIDGQTVCYLVADRDTTSDSLTVIDDGAHLTLEDSYKLLYLGSQSVIAGTLAYKDQTLFLGDLASIGQNTNTEELVLRIKQNMRNNEYGKCTAVEFVYSDDTDDLKDIPNPVDTGNYSYESQLNLTSSNILTFKGGEKYRFALKFQRKDGTETDAFWIGDKVNTLYPYIDKNTGKIKRVVAKCTIPRQVMGFINDSNNNFGFKTVRLMIAEASASDRLVKAQGIVNPTMFNVWERYNDRVFSMSSWISRVRGGNLPYKHFDVVDKCTSSYGEIQCNYWTSDESKTPYYRCNKSTGKYTEEFDGKNTFDLLMIVYTIKYKRKLSDVTYLCTVDVYEAIDCKEEGVNTLKSIDITTDYKNWDKIIVDGITCDQQKTDTYTLRHCTKSFTSTATMNHGNARSKLYSRVKTFLVQDLFLDDLYVVGYSSFRAWCESTYNSSNKVLYGNSSVSTTGLFLTFDSALNGSKDKRWFDGSDNINTGNAEFDPAYYKKHLMFVDENVITIDSPEISKSLVSFQGSGYKFRIVGAVKMTSVTGDYMVDANSGHLSGSAIDEYNFASRFGDNNWNEGIVAWPLYREKGLHCKDDSIDVSKRTSDNYDMENVTNVVRYWIYLWNHSGNITEYTDSEHPDYNILNKKVFANLKYGYNTIYIDSAVSVDTYTDSVISNYDISNDGISSVTYASEQYNPIKSLNADKELTNRYYVGSGKSQLSLPGKMKYPICLSDVAPSNIGHIDSDEPYLYSQSPVTLEYLSDTHAVVKLKTEVNDGVYTDTILPCIFDDDTVTIPQEESNTTSAVIPWVGSANKLKAIVFPKVDGEAYAPTFSSSTNGNSFELQISTIVADSTYKWWEAVKTGIAKANTDKTYLRIISSSISYLVNMNNYSFESGILSVPKSDVIYAVKPTDSDIVVESIATIVNNSEDGVIADDPAKGYKLSLKNNTITRYAVANNGLVPYNVNQQKISFNSNNDDADNIRRGDRYMFIGEIYTDATGNEYGGISDSAILNTRFITAGPAYTLTGSSEQIIYGNQGDTYFQRYDSMRIRPYGSESENGVIDIVSAMLESHINLDGRTDKLRYSKEIASFDPAKFNSINTVYSQQNNFVVKRSEDSSVPDSYHSYITWTLEKKDLSDVDEWTHITLASSLCLDMDKGSCNAIRRFNNGLIAFQDKGISEILFNSRTQLSTENGVPIELGVSGKVEGKIYITNKFGCSDKRTIVEGKNGLYFIDKINKTFCSFNGESIDRLSTNLGFDVWFRDHLSTEIRTFYDNRYSDVYLVKNDDSILSPALCYNETLGVFTSFFDYFNVPAMVNIQDKFVSFKNQSLWLHNAGDYCRFYGILKPFWIQYRVTPDPYGDKIWTNLEYRADFSTVLSGGDTVVPGESNVDINTAFAYDENVTFDYIRFWNEYQTTPMDGKCESIKRFRTWRLAIPRAIADNNENIYGLDRIRNPWVNVLLKKTYTTNSDKTCQDVMQLHDVTIHYFE